MANAQITLLLDIDVVNSDGESIESNHEDWEESQDKCIEKALEQMSNSLCELDFGATVEQD